MLSLRVPAAVESLERINALVQSLAAEAGLPRQDAYRLRFAAEELFVNIVKHGYGSDRSGSEVMVEGDSTTGSAWVRLIDTAAPFDPFAPTRPIGLDRPLQDRVPGALGLYLVRDAVDGASHEYVNGTNRSTVVVRVRTTSRDGQIDDGKDRHDRERV
jgi:serine/threonine-protein kinase RsbW